MLSEALNSVAWELGFLARPPLFFGAAVLELYIDRAEMLDASFRPTEDIDVVVSLAIDVSAQSTVAKMEAALRGHGFNHDQRSHRRNIHAFVSPSGIPVDIVMDALFGEDEWALRSRQMPRRVRLPQGAELLVPTPTHYLACKVAASKNRERWEGDYYSHDLEDIALLLCGCTELVADCEHAGGDLAAYLTAWAHEVLQQASPYGRDARSVLLSNVPRAARIQDLERTLQAIEAASTGR